MEARQGCRTVRDLTINGNVTSLLGLSSLEAAENVFIEDTQLESLIGLENLSRVGNGLRIQDNNNLTSLAGLWSLDAIEKVAIRRNKKLKSLTGLENLTRVGSLWVEENRRLPSLSGLQGLQTGTYMSIQKNPKLHSFDGLQSLKTASVEIYANQKLESLAGLENLTNATRLEIGSCPITSLQALRGLRTAEEIEISYLASLRTLTGLEGIETAKRVSIHANGLHSLVGLESLTRVDRLDILGNRGLSSLSGLQGLRSAREIRLGHPEAVVIYSNGLGSLAGADNLTSVDVLYIYHNPYLLSLGFPSLQSAEEMHILDNNVLSDLDGFESLVSVGMLDISENDGLGSISGFNSLTTGDSLRIHSNQELASLAGFKSLTSVVGDLSISMNDELVNLSGLENLATVGGELSITGRVPPRYGYDRLQRLDGLEGLTYVGELVLARLPELLSMAGLRSLTSARTGVSIVHCDQLRSLDGLGALRHTAQVFMQSGGGDGLEYLGGPFASGAWVGVVRIDTASWPPCITPQERTALVSVVSDINASSIPDIVWPQWRPDCEREVFGTFVCARGLPCTFTLAGKQGNLTSIFISGRFTGCGLCSESQPRSNVTEGGVVDLGYTLSDEEGGLRSICRCAGGREGGPVAQLLLRGPRPSGVTFCSRGRNCTLNVKGEALESTDRVVLMTSCSDGNAHLGYEASWTSENMYLLHDPATWYAAPANRYQVCWRALCTFAADGPVCPAPADTFVHAGDVDLLGVYSRVYTPVLGGNFLVPNIGFGVSDGDRMRLRRSCGEAYVEGMDTLQAKSLGMLFDFGRLTEDRVQAGSHRLCWCQGGDGVRCNAEWHFMADSGEVQILCPVGSELVGSQCSKCPAGRQQLEPGLGSCSECPAGQFSPGGGEMCEACEAGTFAELPGSSACVACQAWASADEDSTGCSADPFMLVLLVSFYLSVGALCAILTCVIKRRLPVVDVSLDQGSTIITTFGSHHLSNFARTPFPVTLHDTGHPGLDAPEQPFRVRVKDAVRLELLTWGGEPIKRRLDASMGTLVVPFPHDLYQQGWLMPVALGLMALFIVVVALGALVLALRMYVEALVGAAAVALASTGASAAVRMRSFTTPLEQRLSEFAQQLAKELHASRWGCEKGPGRAIAVGRLHDLLGFFRDYIRDRTAYYLDATILKPLCRTRRVSYAELVGPGPVEWFVSHFWGTAFEHFCMALQKHAEVVCGERSWTSLRYWVCFCCNNQYRIKEELGETWADSSFYLTLRSGLCKGTCMVLDDKAMPLTRIWCIFELLQTVKLERTDDFFQGLLLCTSSGVLNTGTGSVEVAMALADKVAQMDLEKAEASTESDALMIRKQVMEEMGSYAALNHIVRREVRQMLVRAQRCANEQFGAVLERLDTNMTESTWAISV